jgi:gliding motility-associated-like protein
MGNKAAPYNIRKILMHITACISLLLLGTAVLSQTTADFTISKKEGCIPLSGVNFTDASTGGTVTRRDWNLGNGTIINNGAATVGTNYLTDGAFTVTLTVTFANGDIRTKQDIITVHPKPIAEFIANETEGCSPHAVQFTHQATTKTGIITNWLWDFGAGGSSQPNPSFTYNVNGNYNVSLIVTNNWGCESEAAIKQQYIKVYPKVNASFTIPNNSSCNIPFTTTFVNNTTGGGNITYEWDFGDGQTSTDPNPTHTYTTTGAYTVTLTARNGTNCVSTYTRSGNNGVLAGKPTPTITAPTNVCANTATNFTAGVTPAAFLYTVKWLFPDNGAIQYGQNTTHTFANPGTYEIQVVALNYAVCNDTARHSITVRPGPQPNFTVDRAIGCDTPFLVQFTNTSLPLTDLTYVWNFGDGSPHAALSDPAHTYQRPGYYTVTLTVTDTLTGCTAIMQKRDTIRIVKPIVDFTYTPPDGCRPLPVRATARLSNIVDPVVSYIWDFGDGPPVITTIGNATHTYTAAGNYNIRLKIITRQGCTDSSILKPVSVANLCDDDGSGGGGGGGGGGAGFTLGKTCQDKYTVVFTDTVTNSTPLSWDFGDGSPLYTTPPLNPVTHTFPITGKKYVVTITRHDTITNVTSSAQVRAIIIDEKANFMPSITDICRNKTVDFSTLGIDSSNINKYTWDFGDGTPRYTINNRNYFLNYGRYLNGNTSHTYADTGTFYITLIIEDKLGCLDSLRYPVPVKVKGPLPGFMATPLTTCESNFTTVFTDTSVQNGTTPIIEWTWNFGDGTPAYTTTQDTAIQHAYSNNSYYRTWHVTLNIKDAAGCEAQTIVYNYIKSYRPKAAFFSYDTLKCGSTNVFLYNQSSAYNATYTWYFGDGTSTNTHNASHTYSTNGEYDIKLVVKDENGCADSTTTSAYIKLVKPKADFITGDTSKCAPIAISFYDSSTYAKQYVWNFGDGGTGSTDKDPAPHIYAVPGFYPVKLIITGVSGCVDSITKVIRVKGPIGQLSVGPVIGCAPFTLPMWVTGSNINSYAWDYGDGTPVQASQDDIVNHIYPLAGKFLPNVILTSPEGCPYTLKATDSVIVDSAHARFTIDRPLRCLNDRTIQFTNLSEAAFGAVSWKWLFGDNQTSADEHPSHTYGTDGDYEVALIVQSRYGCIDTLTQPKAVKIFTQPVVNIVGQMEKCAQTAIDYTANIQSEDSIISYTWKLNNNIISHNDSVSHYFANAGDYDLAFTVNTRYGCEETTDTTITIRPLPVPAASPQDTTVCIGSLVPLQAHNGTHYTWWPQTNLQNAGSANPVATALANTRYYVQVTNNFGCVQQDSIMVHVDNKVNLQHSNDAIICRGERTRLLAGGNTQQFVWTPATGLDNSLIASPWASPQQTTTYQVVGYSNNTCPNDTSRVTVTVGSIPTVDLGPDLTVEAGQPIDFNPVTSSDVISYRWQPATGLSCNTCSSPRLIADKDASYRLTVSTQYNCIAADEIRITVTCGKGAVYIPNAFTPNGDNNNDLFYIKGYGIQKVKSLRIYNRWGQIVFSRDNFAPNDKNAAWDGRVKGQIPASGAFIYLAEVICNEGKILPLKGTLMLLK